VPALNALYEQYKDQAAFFVVYIQEAHASNGWPEPHNVSQGIVFADPTSSEERGRLGQLCVRKLGIKFPAVLDTQDNATERAYTAWPDRLYVIDRDGRVAYKAEPGPYGFRPEGVAGSLRKLLPAVHAKVNE
jgi:hypothetical protein